MGLGHIQRTVSTRYNLSSLCNRTLGMETEVHWLLFLVLEVENIYGIYGIDEVYYIDNLL